MIPNTSEMTANQQTPRLSTYSVISPRPEPPKEATIADLWTVIVRRHWLIWGILILVMATAIAMCTTATRMYRAIAVIQVQKDSVDALSLDNMVSNTVSAPDALDTNITLQTQAQILQSESL